MTSCTLRPPWPDELPRIAATFPQLPRLIGSRPLVVVSAGTERLLGAAAVLPPPPAAAGAGGSACGFVCAFTRRALLESTTADQLVGGILALAREERASRVVYAASLREEDPRCPVLRRAGFAPMRADELWDIDPRGMADRLARIHAALTPGGRLRGFTAAALTEGDLPEVRTLVADAGLLAPEQIFLAGGATTGGYDPASSTVVRHDGRLTGVLLARVSGRLSVVEARVVAPAWRGGLNLTNHLLFQRSVSTGLAAGCERLLFTADPQKEAETVRMAQRFGGRLASRNQRWRRDLVPEAQA